jgi:hypothetical protein
MAPFRAGLSSACNTSIAVLCPEDDDYATLTQYASNHPMMVQSCHLDQLKPKGWLGTELMTFQLWLIANRYIENLHTPRPEFSFIQSGYWMSWESSKGRRLPPRTYLDDPISSKYVCIPINVHKTHWILAIISHCSDLVGANAEGPIRTRILLLDSMHEKHPLIVSLLRRLLKAWLPDDPLARKRLGSIRVQYPDVSSILSGDWWS